MGRGRGVGFVVGLVLGLVLNAVGLFASSDIVLMAGVLFGCAFFGWLCDLVGYIVSGNYAVDKRVSSITHR